tara:strand:- start:776 stop:1606 length:831 start_codon:yes stop_codon:yes gene_type:complete
MNRITIVTANIIINVFIATIVVELFSDDISMNILYVVLCLVIVLFILRKWNYADWKFKRWCKRSGIHFSKLDVGYNQHMRRGLYATDDIKTGDMLIEVPLTSCIHEEVLPDTTLVEGDYILSTKLMLHDKSSGKFEGYMDYMPRDPHLIADWSDTEIDRINYPRGYELREMQKKDNEIYPKSMKRYMDLVRSRRIIYRYEASHVLMMIPMIDMINHGTTPENNGFEIDTRIEDKYIRLYSPRNYRKGEEILMSYGDTESGYESIDHHLYRHGFFAG